MSFVYSVIEHWLKYMYMYIINEKVMKEYSFLQRD